MTDFIEMVRKKLKDHQPAQITAPDRIPAAVLAPFFEKNGEPHLLFTRRTSHLQFHRGEICFPGGSREAGDSDLQATALREFSEEIRIPHEQIEILGKLENIRTVSSFFLVAPYVGYLKRNMVWDPDPHEVEQILEVPYHHLQDPAIFREEIRLVDQKPHPVYYYQWQSHTIWGVTARILKTLMDLLSS